MCGRRWCVANHLHPLWNLKTNKIPLVNLIESIKYFSWLVLVAIHTIFYSLMKSYHLTSVNYLVCIETSIAYVPEFVNWCESYLTSVLARCSHGDCQKRDLDHGVPSHPLSLRDISISSLVIQVSKTSLKVSLHLQQLRVVGWMILNKTIS